MNDTALLLDSDARPLPPWKQHPDLSPLSSAWHSGPGAGAMAGWRAAYDAMPPTEQVAYERRYPAPLYWYWFYGDGGPGSRLMVLATFPLWMLVWALVKTVRGALGRTALGAVLGSASLLMSEASASGWGYCDGFAASTGSNLMDIIALSIPVFFVLMSLEFSYALISKRALYRLNDSLNDLACGVINQVVSVFTAVLIFSFYVTLYEAYHLFPIPETGWWAWTLCVLGVDLGYYWFHRMSHEVNFLWVTHVVHHQSEEYNLSVALRQGAIEPWATWVFYLPLAFLGFPPLMFLTCQALITLYQFWIHTRAIDRLGPLEAVLTTPSHHRVHHGCNPKYLDRNYAGFLILWDKIFGTFQAEEEEPTYGLVKPLASWNPVYANLKFRCGFGNTLEVSPVSERDSEYGLRALLPSRHLRARWKVERNTTPPSQVGEFPGWSSSSPPVSPARSSCSSLAS